MILISCRYGGLDDVRSLIDNFGTTPHKYLISTWLSQLSLPRLMLGIRDTFSILRGATASRLMQHQCQCLPAVIRQVLMRHLGTTALSRFSVLIRLPRHGQDISRRHHMRH